MKGRKALIATLLLLSIITTAFGAYILHYTLVKQSGVDVIMNTWKIELFLEQECINVADAIAFPSVEEEVGGTVTTPRYYLKNLAEVRNILAFYDVTDLPDGMSLDATQYHEDPIPTEQVWACGTEDFEGQLYLYPSTEPDWVGEVEWHLTVDPSVVADFYDFTINIFAKENVS